ncbi:MAG: HAD-IA family hydrolase [Pseudomonadota bacterium]
MRLVLFDVDGTLVDSQAHIVAAMDAAFAAIGRTSPRRSQTLSIVGLSLPRAMEVLAPDADNAALVDAYKTAYQDLRTTHGESTASPLFPGIQAVLETLHAQPETFLGVATGKSRRGLDHVMEVHDLGHFFHTRQDADGHPSKPHPSMARAALYETGCSRGVMIGDTTFDMDMGRAAGLAALGVTWGYHSAEQLLPRADALVEKAGDILAALDSLCPEHETEANT